MKFIEHMLTMRPNPLARICGITARDHRKVLRMWALIILSQASTGMSSTL